MRQTHAAALGTLLLFGFGIPAASAGPCAQQISQLEKTMSSKDAGSGPVSTGNASQPPRSAARPAMRDPRMRSAPRPARKPARRRR